MKYKEVTIKLPIIEQDGEVYEPIGEYRLARGGEYWKVDDENKIKVSVCTTGSEYPIYKKVEKPNKLQDLYIDVAKKALEEYGENNPCDDAEDAYNMEIIKQLENISKRLEILEKT